MISRTSRRGLVLTFLLAAPALVMPTALASAQQEDQSDKKDDKFVIKTPSVALGVSTSPDLAHLGLPLYPGAKYFEDKQDNGLDFGLKISGKVDVHFVAVKFRTPDSLEQVRAFYQKRLGKEVTKFTWKDKDGDMVFEIKHPKDQRFVGLKAVDNQTEIHLVRMQGIDDKDSGE